MGATVIAGVYAPPVFEFADNIPDFVSLTEEAFAKSAGNDRPLRGGMRGLVPLALNAARYRFLS